MSKKSLELVFWSAEKKRTYENAMALLIRQIQKIEVNIAKSTGRHIIRYIEQRLKSEKSIAEKIKRKGIGIEEINDLAGVRVICFDTKQVDMLVNEVRDIKDFQVLKEKDYISHPKDNGYQSYHMILKIGEVKVELQIRTILMDAWSSLETVLVYKKSNAPSNDVAEKIRKFSKWSKKMDRMVEEMLEAKN